MTKLVNAVRPAGQREDYRFVKDADTGRTFKVLATFDETAGHDPVLKLSLAEVDDEAHAVTWPDGSPVLFTHSHTFTPTELEAPNFDIDARVSAILYTSIAAEESRRLARTKVGSLESKWKGKSGLVLTPPPPPLPPEAVSVIGSVKGD